MRIERQEIRDRLSSTSEAEETRAGSVGPIRAAKAGNVPAGCRIERMIGARVGHFEILEKLGEGGMGVV